jgi:1-acyl-sn-glycerol-3-phosphate acyltransferase
MAQRSIANRLFYTCLRVLCRIIGVTFFSIRCLGRQHLPAQGPVLVCANHQSYFDPVIVGLTFNRRLNYLARQTLFRSQSFAWLIDVLGAIPINREGTGLAGLKEGLRRIKEGEMLLIFPEGTRTRDGSVGPFQPGFLMLARRGGVALLPVGLDGAYDAWPRNASLPRLSSVRVCVGEPLTADEVQQLDDGQLIGELERRVRACFQVARDSRQRQWEAI